MAMGPATPFIHRLSENRYLLKSINGLIQNSGNPEMVAMEWMFHSLLPASRKG
jgi:hypothetical protein